MQLLIVLLISKIKYSFKHNWFQAIQSLSCNSKVLEKCSQQTGWFSEPVFTAIRNITRMMIQKTIVYEASPEDLFLVPILEEDVLITILMFYSLKTQKMESQVKRKLKKKIMTMKVMKTIMILIVNPTMNLIFLIQMMNYNVIKHKQCKLVIK